MLPQEISITYENLASTFYSEHVETKEITFRLLKIIKNTFRNTTNTKTIRFRFTSSDISIISTASKMAEAD